MIPHTCLAMVAEDDHLDYDGLCQCSCPTCTDRSQPACLCPECGCDTFSDHAHWIWDDSGARRGGTS